MIGHYRRVTGSRLRILLPALPTEILARSLFSVSYETGEKDCLLCPGNWREADTKMRLLTTFSSCCHFSGSDIG